MGLKRVLSLLFILVIILGAVFFINNFDKLFPTAPPSDATAPSSEPTVLEPDIGSLPLKEFEIPEFSSLYCFSQLTETQKSVYNIMVSKALSMETGSFGIGHCEVSDMIAAFSAVRLDLPELFWLSSNYLYSKTPFGISVTFSGGDGKTSYLCDRETRDAMQKKLYYKAEAILKAIPENASDFEKELYIYDAICATTEYEQNGSQSLTAYGALVDGRAVCEGYSRAMQLLLRYAGIDSTLVLGTAENTGHLWSLVKIENVWYHLDVTFGDTKGDTPAHGFFNMNDKVLSKTHSLDPLFSKMSEKELKNGDSWNFPLPACESDTHFYPVYKNVLLNDDKPASQAKIIAALLSAAKNGERSVEFYIDSKELEISSKYGLNHCISEVNKQLKTKIRIPSVTYMGNATVLSIKYEGE